MALYCPFSELTFIAYLLALAGALLDMPVAYSSRIDGCVLPLDVVLGDD